MNRNVKVLFSALLIVNVVIVIGISVFLLQTPPLMTYSFGVRVQNASGQPVQNANLDVYAKLHASSNVVLWQTLSSDSYGNIEIYTINPNYDYITSWTCYATNYQTTSGAGVPPSIITLQTATNPTPTPTSTPTTPTPTPPTPIDLMPFWFWLLLAAILVAIITWLLARRKKK
jgi:uncharacterized Zn-finger protein